MKQIEIELGSQLFFDFINSVSAITEESVLRIYKDKMQVLGLSADGICLVNTQINAKDCTTYDVEEEKQFGLNFENMSKSFPDAGDYDVVNLKILPTKLSMLIKNDLSTRELSFNITNASIHNSDKEPNLKYKAGFNLTGKTLKDIMKNANACSGRGKEGEVINIIVKKEGVWFAVKSIDNNYNEKFSESVINYFNGDEQRGERASYNTLFLKKFLKCCGNKTTVSIEFLNEEPLRLSYPLNNETVSYYVAPFMEDKN